MPIYEYQCKKCKGVFEILQNFNDKPASKCERCGGKLKRLISLSAFHLKGSGWYETDYGKKKITDGKQLKDHSTQEANSDTQSSSENSAAATASKQSDGSDSGKVYDSIKSDTSKAKRKTKGGKK